ncbi:ankyrin repeat domain-containing protein 27-like [Penaeus monodon]|uniref:ankyrin repeat domain-containing protein 27-like n=1 Tax=Penaeus monodon TaxID=6687 RepID=UPI0018A766E1|nr:ankyrin repeat domain-containing protein 27-like [Penaeus monodon]
MRGTGDTRIRRKPTATPLHLAARCGHVTSCRLLVGNGADKEAKDLRGYTALHWAAKMVFQSVVVSCSSLDLRASPAIQNNKGETPFHCAQYSPGEVRKLFEAHPDIDLITRARLSPLCCRKKEKQKC